MTKDQHDEKAREIVESHTPNVMRAEKLAEKFAQSLREAEDMGGLLARASDNLCKKCNEVRCECGEAAGVKRGVSEKLSAKFQELDTLLASTHCSYEEGCDAWVKMTKLFPELMRLWHEAQSLAALDVANMDDGTRCCCMEIPNPPCYQCCRFNKELFAAENVEYRKFIRDNFDEEESNRIIKDISVILRLKRQEAALDDEGEK